LLSNFTSGELFEACGAGSLGEEFGLFCSPEQSLPKRTSLQMMSSLVSVDRVAQLSLRILWWMVKEQIVAGGCHYWLATLNVCVLGGKGTNQNS
jgi:hypothetical protein